MTPDNLLDDYARFLVPLAPEHLADVRGGVTDDFDHERFEAQR